LQPEEGSEGGSGESEFSEEVEESEALEPEQQQTSQAAAAVAATTLGILKTPSPLLAAAISSPLPATPVGAAGPSSPIPANATAPVRAKGISPVDDPTTAAYAFVQLFKASMHAQMQAVMSDYDMYVKMKKLGAKCAKITKLMKTQDADVAEMLEPGLQQAEDELAMTEDVFSRTSSGKLSAQFHAFVEVYMSPAFDLPALEDLLG